MSELGKMERIEDLRTVWKNEARDFTGWLAQEENFALLSDAVGIGLELEERESAVDSFSVDLFATEEGTGRNVVIENQLEDTNHDHLGKIITYAAGKEASVIIWIVKHAKDAHRNAIEWLNQHTDEEIGFFLVEIQLWKIDDSRVAPMFHVIESPNEWAKAVKNGGLTDTKQTYVEYWEAFKKYAFSRPDMKKAFTERKARASRAYDLAVGKNHCHISLLVSKTQSMRSAHIYISNDKSIYDRIKEHKDEIEKMVGGSLSWYEAGMHASVGWDNIESDLDESNWEKFFEWYCECALKLKEVVRKFG